MKKLLCNLDVSEDSFDSIRDCIISKISKKSSKKIKQEVENILEGKSNGLTVKIPTKKFPDIDDENILKRNEDVILVKTDENTIIKATSVDDSIDEFMVSIIMNCLYPNYFPEIISLSLSENRLYYLCEMEMLDGTLYQYLKNVDTGLAIDALITVIGMLEKLNREVYFIHGDLHLSNVMYKMINKKPHFYFIDLGDANISLGRDYYYRQLSGLSGSVEPDFRDVQVLLIAFENREIKELLDVKYFSNNNYHEMMDCIRNSPLLYGTSKFLGHFPFYAKFDCYNITEEDKILFAHENVIEFLVGIQIRLNYKVNWENLSEYKLSENFMIKYADKLDWDKIVKSQILSEKFIIENKKYLNMKSVVKYQKHLSKTFLKALPKSCFN